MVQIIKREDGMHLCDNDVESEVLALTKDERSYILPENSTGRQWFAVKRAPQNIGDAVEVLPRNVAPRVDGEKTHSLPNAKLIAYLPEDEQAEYKAIVERAIAAKKQATQSTPESKALAKLEKAKAALAALGIDVSELNIPDHTDAE